jgi:hypothetical protein
MKKYIFGLILMVLAMSCFSQRTRINPTTQVKKAPKKNMVLMSREIDSCYVPVPIDSAIKNIAGLPNYYYGTPVLNVVGDSLMIRDAQWDPFSRYYITAPFGGFYINNVVNKRVAYVKVNDTLLVNYSTDFGNDTIRVSPPPKYRVYTIQFSQFGTNAPTTTAVLENTLGVTPTWTRDYAGKYTITATGRFGSAKTFVTVSPGLTGNNPEIILADPGDDTVEFYTQSAADLDCVKNFLEIRVYK